MCKIMGNISVQSFEQTQKFNTYHIIKTILNFLPDRVSNFFLLLF